MEPGEAPADAIVREVREETGLQARVLCELGIVPVASEGSSFSIHEFRLVPVGPVLDPRPADDAADARWFAPDELPALELTTEVLDVIDRARKARLRPGEP